MASFLAELRRRHVVKVCIAYLAMAWLLLQVADTVLSAFAVAEWVMQALIILFALGLPVVIGIAWVFELTPDGVKRTDEIPPQGRLASPKGRKLDFAIIALLALALMAVVIDQYVIESTSVPNISKLAVLPLANLSGSSEQQYFADGMTEALITNLAKVSALRVVSRMSVMRFKDSDRSLLAIAAELAVDAIVTGSAMRQGDRIRITAQLIDAATDQHLWAETYDRDYKDVLIVQSEIAQTIARQIRINVTPEESSRLARIAEASTDGYDDYLKGMQRFYRLTPNDLETALQYFDLSLEQNPNSALAHSGVAATWIGLRQMGFVPSSEATPKAEAAALRALELDSELAEPHVWLAIAKAWGNWEWAEAEELFQRAIELNPSYADARGSYGHLLAILGRFDESFEQLESGLSLDPFNGWILGQYGVVLHMTNQYDQAIAAFQNALRISPDLPFVWLVLAGSYHYSGKYEEAIEAEGSLMAALGDTDGQRVLMRKYEEGGYQEAMSWLADRAAEHAAAAGSLGWWAAIRYAHAGQDEKVIEWLQGADEQQDPNLPFLRMPEFEKLHSDPRIRQLMRQTDIL